MAQATGAQLSVAADDFEKFWKNNRETPLKRRRISKKELTLY
ncbi:hypothetical protein [Aedoeadaptatus acetigenes]|nr:hypothetical protein [Aedoeadaptatus acetigenes]MCU6786852.1 hypothetical protein [Aedoeadaptatus acetigenes]